MSKDTTTTVAVTAVLGGSERRRSIGRERLAPVTAKAPVVGKYSARNRAKALRRAASPIHGYVGPNGGGKSLAMVNDSIAALESGRTVLSTVRLLDPRTGDDHPSYVKFTDFQQLLDVEHADVLMDEVVGIASAQDSARMDPKVQNLLMQLRRRDVRLRWTAPAWDRAAKPIRQVTQAVTECRGHFSDSAAVADGSRLWAPKRLFRWRTFAAVDFEDWTAGKRDRLDPEVRQWFWGPGSAAFGYYDTLDAVSRVAGVSEGGRCENCGGTVSIPRCKCGAH
jgi:hypothetical protein